MAKATKSAAPKTAAHAAPTNLAGAARSVASAVANTRNALRSDTPGPLRAPDTSKMTSELANIDFRKMLGGPLQAAVDSQIASSLASIDFINKVGFNINEDTGKKELIYVDFTHEQQEFNPEGTTEEEKWVKTTKNVKVPLLAMVQVPSLRIEYVEVTFNAKLNSVESSSVSDKLNVAAEVSAGWGPVSFKVSASYQRQTATAVKIEKEYALNIKMRAVQDEMPRGLEEIFNLLK